jgi:long-subunit acyl-CoA synthetase (AMP-forming)
LSIFASTRPEWQVSAQAAFEQGLVVVTVYPSLGPDALSYSLNQTQVSHLITQVSLLDIVTRSIGQLNGSLKTIIYLDQLTPTQVQEYQKKCGLEVSMDSRQSNERIEARCACLCMTADVRCCIAALLSVVAHRLEGCPGAWSEARAGCRLEQEGSPRTEAG